MTARTSCTRCRERALASGKGALLVLVREARIAIFSTKPLDEARRAVRLPRRATQELYREYVRCLGRATAGRLDLGLQHRPLTERPQLKAAVWADAINLHIQRRGNAMVFWKTDQLAKPSGGGARRGQRRKQ